MCSEATLLDRAIAEINELQPDIVSAPATSRASGSSTAPFAREYLDKIECESMVVIPGNHDSRNVGYVHFEELFGERNRGLPKAG